MTNARAAYVKGLKTTHENDMLSYKQDLNNFLKENNSEVVSLKAPNILSIMSILSMVVVLIKVKIIVSVMLSDIFQVILNITKWIKILLYMFVEKKTVIL